MRLDELRQRYSDATESASTVARNLCLAGLAFTWLFAAPDLFNGTPASDINKTLLVTGVLFSLGVLTDVVQLVFRAEYLARAYRIAERQVWADDEARMREPNPVTPDLGPKLRRVTRLLWWGKVLFTFVGWGVAVYFLATFGG